LTPAPFVYAFAAVADLPPPAALRRLPTMPGGSKPRVLGVRQGLSLVVADVPRAVYAADVLEPRLADAEWVAAAAAAHHAAIERLARTRSLVPFRIFTIFSSDARARQITAARAAPLRRALARLDGRQEWVLRIGPPDRARASEPRPADTRRSGVVSGTDFLQQKATAATDRQARAARVTAQAARVVTALEAAADEATVRPPPPGTSLLVDAAFLVASRRRAAFRRALDAHAAPLLAEGCAVTLTGPWPPYSFTADE
jgi:hypothetical protein